jgi:hypothetical protein
MAEHTRMHRRAFLGTVALTAAGAPSVFAQSRAERRVEPILLPLDKADVWTFHFRYKPPRIVTLEGLDRVGKKAPLVVWYMWYQVYNLSSDPQTFLPEFELVTKDLNTTHLDEPQPHLLAQLNKLENPTGHERLELLSSITISKRPIPPSKPDAIPIVVTGAAIWTDMFEKAPRTNKFSVYVTGLSNGLAIEETPLGEKLIRRKVLQINFIRPTDDNRPQITDIVPDDANGPPEKWIYRTVSTLKPKAP